MVAAHPRAHVQAHGKFDFLAGLDFRTQGQARRYKTALAAGDQGKFRQGEGRLQSRACDPGGIHPGRGPFNAGLDLRVGGQRPVAHIDSQLEGLARIEPTIAVAGRLQREDIDEAVGPVHF